jgi:hypothetical protein
MSKRGAKGHNPASEKWKPQTEQVRAALLALNDEQLQCAVAHLCPFTLRGEQARMQTGYQVCSLTTKKCYHSEADLSVSEGRVSFTFVMPDVVALRDRLARATTGQLFHMVKAMSNHAPYIDKIPWHERLLVALPDFANGPLPDTPPPVVNPDFDMALLDAALRQTTQTNKEFICQSLITQIADLFRNGTRYELSGPNTLIDTRTPFLVEDYATAGDFLDEWNGQGSQLNNQIQDTVTKLLIDLLPQALDWLERENPTYYREMLAHLTYYSLEDFAPDDKEQVARAIFSTDLIGDTFILLEVDICQWIVDRPFAEILHDVDVPLKQSRQKMLALPQLTTLLHDLESYCYTTAIVTLTTEDDQLPLTMDLHREDGAVQFGYAPGHKDLLMARLINYGGLILRSFLEEKDPQTGLPIKELRGWSLMLGDGDLVVTRIPADDLYWACNTDSQTGERLKPEPDVRYC